MVDKNKLYPLLFDSNVQTLVWGTEDWTVSAVPGMESVVSNGLFEGKLLTDVIRLDPELLLGQRVAERTGDKMPLLAKVIDAHADLSIQVHPNDEMALREHGKLGKCEMWYILSAKPGAYLYSGFKKAITQEEYRQRIQAGTICDVLARHEVHPGDVFYLPAGRVHSICGGIRLCEIQESSDVTYRIFDYNRPGLDGRPRQLHTELAAQALDFRVYKNYRTRHTDLPNFANPCLDTPQFAIRYIRATQPTRFDVTGYDSFVILMSIQGESVIRLHDSDVCVNLSEGASCFIPAAVADFDVLPLEDEARILEAYIGRVV